MAKPMHVVEKDRAASAKDKAASAKDKAASAKDKAASAKDKAASAKDRAASVKDKTVPVQSTAVLPSLNWDDVLLPHVGAKALQRLAHARVGIAGAGGLGSNCAMVLARSGVGHLVLVDDDVVSVSNLNRQCYTPDQVGQPKVAALCAAIGAVNGQVCLTAHQVRLDPALAVSLFQDCQVVVEAVDNPVTKRMLVETWLAAGHVVVSASGMAGWGGDMTRKTCMGGRLTVVGDFSQAVSAHNPPMGPRVLMAAAMQADEVLCRLLNG